jgi:NitT/TauT family transport system substrate-binding protein
VRFMQAYRETIAYMYSANPQVIKDYAEFNNISEAMARRVRDDFFPRGIVEPDEIKGLDSLLPEAVALKFIEKPLTKEQLTELIRVPLK